MPSGWLACFEEEALEEGGMHAGAIEQALHPSLSRLPESVLGARLSTVEDPAVTSLELGSQPPVERLARTQPFVRSRPVQRRARAFTEEWPRILNHAFRRQTGHPAIGQAV